MTEIPLTRGNCGGAGIRVGVRGGFRARAGGYCLKKSAAPAERVMEQVLLIGKAPRGEEFMLEEVCPEGLQPVEGPPEEQGKV